MRKPDPRAIKALYEDELYEARKRLANSDSAGGKKIIQKEIQMITRQLEQINHEILRKSKQSQEKQSGNNCKTPV